MKFSWVAWSWLAGAVGGLVGNGVLGGLFTSPWAQSVLYDPQRQSALFLSITPQRNVAVSVAGLVILSSVHGWLYTRLRDRLGGSSWWQRGLRWGAIIWVMYWLFQEWFIYVTLLGEPVPLAVFELLVLLFGSLVEGFVIAGIMQWVERGAARGAGAA
jgi:hypothetical protein